MIKQQRPARYARPIEELAMMTSALEKLSLLPRDEVLLNDRMVAEIKNTLSASNIDALITNIVNEYNEARNVRVIPAASENALLYAYAQREHKRLKGAGGKEYVTEIVNAADLNDLQKQEKPPAKATRRAEEAFSSVFNSIYSNGAVKINTPSDPSILMSYIDYSPYRVNYTEYLSVPTLSEMVDRPIAMALKNPFEVKTKNEKFKAVLEKKFKKVQLQAVLKDMLFNSTLSPRGSLLVPIKRGNSVTFNVFNDTQFAYGMGASYGGLTAPYNQTRVGDLYCFGAKLKHGVSAFFLCPGFEPLFGVGINRVPQLRAAAEAWNLYVHILKILLVRAQVIVEKMEGDVQTDTMLSAMRAQLQRLSESMGVSTPIAQARGTQMEILNNNISEGTGNIAGVFRDYVASVTGLAPEYFFGGGNTNYSQAAFQIAATNEHVRSRFQIAMIEPMARFVVDTFIRNDAEVAACGVSEGDFEIEFESIYDETDQEREDLKAKRTETLIRQREYPELESAFKQLKLLDEDITFEGMEQRDENGSDISAGDEADTSVLTNPMSIGNAMKVGTVTEHKDGTKWKKVSEGKWEQVKTEGGEKTREELKESTIETDKGTYKGYVKDAKGKPTYYNYRRNESEQNEEIIFAADNPDESAHYGDIQNVFVPTERTDTNHDEIAKIAAQFYSVGLDEAKSLVNPDRIVSSAGAWDDIDFINYVYEETNYFSKHDGIITNDGAIFFEKNKDNYLGRRDKVDD